MLIYLIKLRSKDGNNNILESSFLQFKHCLVLSIVCIGYFHVVLQLLMHFLFDNSNFLRFIHCKDDLTSYPRQTIHNIRTWIFDGRHRTSRVKLFITEIYNKKKTCFLENIAHRLPHLLPVFQAIGECHAKKTACILR